MIWRTRFVAFLLCAIAANPALPQTTDTLAPAPQANAMLTYKPVFKCANEITVVFNGSRNSRIEPCGCRARNLGGIDKEAGMIEQFRKENSATLVLEAGGYFRDFVDENFKLQTWYMLEALRLMKLNAINIGYRDLTHGVEFLKQLEQEKQLPLISANIKDGATGKTLFPPHRIAQVKLKDGRTIRIGIVGATAPKENAERPGTGPAASEPRAELSMPSPIPGQVAGSGDGSSWQGVPGGGEGRIDAGTTSPAVAFALSTTGQSARRYDIVDEIPVLEEEAKKLRGECDVLILLEFSTVERTKKIIEKVPSFDVVIAGEYSMKGPAFKYGPRNTLLAAPEHEGRYLGQVDVCFAKEGKQIEDMSGDVIPIDQNIEAAPAITRVISLYKNDIEKLPVAPGQVAAGDKLFVGASRCQTCHSREYKQWKTTKHSRAMPTLVKKNMQFNPDCLRCHTVAYKRAGGFVDLRVTPNLSNVQCESCHGPGKKHIEEQMALSSNPDAGKNGAKRQVIMRTRFDGPFCKQCHDPNNDPDFDFESDYKHIIHSSTDPDRHRTTSSSATMAR